MSLLKRLKVSHALTISTLMPMLVALLLLSILVSGLSTRIQQHRVVEDAVMLSMIFDGIAHNHAVERGLTAGFIGSGGTSGKDKVDAQRLKANEAVNALMNFDLTSLQAVTSEEFESLAAPIKQQLTLRAGVRQKVDQVSPDNGAFDFYSELNRRSLVAIERLLLRVNEPEAAKLMNARLQLLWMKERAGQYRGALNGIFSAGQTNAARKQTVVGFLQDEQNRLQVFEMEAPASYLQKLKGFESSNEWRAVKSAVDGFIANNDLANVVGPANWFDIATARIGNIKAISDDIGAKLVADVQAVTRAESRLVTLLVGLFLVIMIPVWILGFLVNRSITSRVHRIKQYLHEVSNRKAFNEELADDSHDEIGDIIQALNAHIDEVRKSLSYIQGETEQSSELLKSIREHSKVILTDAREQFDNTDQIATAMAEMSQTSLVIATDMQEASSETNSLQERGHEGSERITQITQSINELDEEINKTYRIVEEVSENSDGINQILQTIESIAEQTNLLALNAAIEAARAGEQGRGFAVVADEVRSLASRTQGSTVEIRTMIESLVSSSTGAIESMEHCKALTDNTAEKVNQNSEMIQALFASVDKLNESIEKVATAAEEQSHVSEDINKNVQRVADGSQDILDSTQNNNATVESMSDKFEQMHGKISEFKLS